MVFVELYSKVRLQVVEVPAPEEQNVYSTQIPDVSPLRQERHVAERAKAHCAPLERKSI